MFVRITAISPIGDDVVAGATIAKTSDDLLHCTPVTSIGAADAPPENSTSRSQRN